MRLVLPMLLGGGMLGVVIGDVVQGHVGLGLLTWLAPGILIGYPFGRMTKLTWQDDQLNVVMDRGQIALILVYVVVRYATRAAVTTVFGDLTTIGDILLLVTGGTLIGRSLGIIRPIRMALKLRPVHRHQPERPDVNE